MIINGLIFGERSITYEGTNYVIDFTNLIIAEITYNALNRSIFQLKSNPDYLKTEIYQVTNTFMKKFINSGRNISPKKDNKNILLKTITG
jgi:hypothetical protein